MMVVLGDCNGCSSDDSNLAASGGGGRGIGSDWDWDDGGDATPLLILLEDGLVVVLASVVSAATATAAAVFVLPLTAKANDCSRSSLCEGTAPQS